MPSKTVPIFATASLVFCFSLEIHPEIMSEKFFFNAFEIAAGMPSFGFLEKSETMFWIEVDP